MGSPHGCPWCGAPAPAAQAGRGRDGDGRRPAAAQHRRPRPRGRSRAEPSPCGLGAEGRPRRLRLASRLPSPRHGEPGAAAETRCTAQRCPQLLPTKRQRCGLGDLPPFPHPWGRARWRRRRRRDTEMRAARGAGGHESQCWRCRQLGNPGAHPTAPPQRGGRAPRPRRPGYRGHTHRRGGYVAISTTEGTPPHHCPSAASRTGKRKQQNKKPNVRYSIISWETKERPLLPSLPS